MLGAILGDVVGSRFEWHNIKSKDFELLDSGCYPTDDSVMTLAVAEAIIDAGGDARRLSPCVVTTLMRSWGRAYPHAGYGGRFREWLAAPDPLPYRSFGNGAAMRVSACGWAGDTLQDAIELARAVTAVTHGHPEGMKGAEATVACIWLARAGRSRREIREHVEGRYYPLDFTLADIRPSYSFDETCQGSVPQAIEAFLEAEDFEDAIRNAVSIGGDSDTVAAIAGGIAEAAFGIPSDLRERALAFLDERMLGILEAFEATYPPAAGRSSPR